MVHKEKAKAQIGNHYPLSVDVSPIGALSSQILNNAHGISQKDIRVHNFGNKNRRVPTMYLSGLCPLG